VPEVFLQIISPDAVVVGAEPDIAVASLCHRADIAQGNEFKEAVLCGAHGHAHAVEADPQGVVIVDIEALQRVVRQRAGVGREVEPMIQLLSLLVEHDQSVVVCGEQHMPPVVQGHVVDWSVVDESPCVSTALVAVGFVFGPSPSVALPVADGVIMLVGCGVVVGNVVVSPCYCAAIAVDPRHGAAAVDQT